MKKTTKVNVYVCALLEQSPRSVRFTSKISSPICSCIYLQLIEEENFVLKFKFQLYISYLITNLN